MTLPTLNWTVLPCSPLPLTIIRSCICYERAEKGSVWSGGVRLVYLCESGELSTVVLQQAAGVLLVTLCSS